MRGGLFMCLEIMHEEFTPGLSRWLPEEFYYGGSARCLSCHEARRLERERQWEEEEEEELKRCGCSKHDDWFEGGAWLPVEQFSKDKSKSDGLQHWCKFCDREKQRLRREKNKRRLQGVEEKKGATKKCTCKRHRELAGRKVPRRQPVAQFNVNYSSADGRNSYCKACSNALKKEKRKKNAERNKKRKKDEVPDGTKRCGSKHHVGERELPYEDFYRDRTKKDGFESRCKECCAVYKKRARVEEEEEEC
eukprot:TRINITY_DN785_c0_g1_i19.p2 TRINITY_DN785_c0_g1~~TRINITY_DN785_c0_g1_i19.p2  ORF type:complete len:249 (-),score=-68.48 TRINITY_DN785_c0_g1_i19:25-771(-)